jgi:hypothetical protein
MMGQPQAHDPASTSDRNPASLPYLDEFVGATSIAALQDVVEVTSRA